MGRKIGIPFGRTIHCPVRALENWLDAARIGDVPISDLSIDTGGSLAPDFQARQYL